MRKFIPPETSKCIFCGGPHPGKFRDLVGIWVGFVRIAICHSCALDLVRLLLDRFYPIWGDGPVHDLMAGPTTPPPNEG